MRCHSYWPVAGFRTCWLLQWLVPNGGKVGAVIGAIAGGTSGHMVGAQIGFRSIELSHNAWTLPFTHRHSQFACAEPKIDMSPMQAPTLRIAFICPPFKPSQRSEIHRASDGTIRRHQRDRGCSPLCTPGNIPKKHPKAPSGDYGTHLAGSLDC